MSNETPLRVNFALRATALLCLPLLLLSVPARAEVTPATEAQRALLDATPEDTAPEKLDATRPDLENRHYLTGDEANLHLFYERLRDLGGGYAGVGSDQAYLFIGWMKPDFAWVADYDPWIKDLHHAYRAFFERAEDINTFRAFWDPKNVKTSRALLEEVYASHPRKRNIVHVFDQASYKVFRRLRRLVKWMKDNKVPSFVTDEAMYQDVRARVMAGRVKPLLCNLLDEACMKGLGDTMRKLQVPLRTLYLSNAEQYWSYGKQFRENIRAQHFDDRSVVIRTIAVKNANKDYHYNVQPGLNFQAWLEADWVRNSRQVAPYVPIRSEEDIPFTEQKADPESVRPKKKSCK